MTDKDYAPLSASCVRSLNDKMYEKRKVAALEIERMVREYVATNNTSQIQRLLHVLGQDFTMSQNPNSRKGGLIGLAATAIALSRDSSNYVQELVKPVLKCFLDSDSRVRYYGCEALYNIVKVARGSVLPFFNDIFDGLSKLCADADNNVRSGAELLDRLMKDIVTESCQFDLVAFMPLLRERIYTKNPFARQFLVSWITTLDAVPDIEMVIFLPEILDGLFHILGDQSPEIRKMSEAALGEFLLGVSKKSTMVDYPSMANILITHCMKTDEVIRYTAITWLKEFVHLSGRTMLPFTSGILTAVLPCLAYDDLTMQDIHEAAKAVNGGMMRLVVKEDDDQDQEQNDKKQGSGEGSLDLGAVVEVLMRQMLHDSMQTRIAALRWIYHLFVHTPNKMFQQINLIFPLLLKALSDPSDEVALLDLEVLAEISSSPAGSKYPPALAHPVLPSAPPLDNVANGITSASTDKEGTLVADVEKGGTLEAAVQRALEEAPPHRRMTSHFTQFLVSLMRLFSTDRQLLEDRGSFIIRQLCLLLDPENIYRCCSEVLLHETDMKFASLMIDTLSSILLTSTELFELRSQLKDLKTKESCSLFCCLYRAWCHNPVSTVALCFLTQNYEHASNLLTLFGELEVTMNFLTEIDKLVQLIESPIFTYLRLQLLDVHHKQHLLRSLYGLLMLLPQSDAFHKLQHRLHCVPNIQFLPAEPRVPSPELDPSQREHVKTIDFTALLQHFKDVQQKHRADRHKPKTVEDFDKKFLN